MPCPSDPWLVHSNYTWTRVQVTKFLNLLSFHLSSVQIFSSAPCSQTPSVYVNACHKESTWIVFWMQSWWPRLSLICSYLLVTLCCLSGKQHAMPFSVCALERNTRSYSYLQLLMLLVWCFWTYIQ
jgi:hypothetical protein